MEILTMEIKVDQLPENCVVGSNGDGCIFNQHKYCVLKMALNEKDTFVQNNRESLPVDCPLKKRDIINKNIDDKTKEVIYECITFLKGYGFEVTERDSKIGKWVAYKRDGMLPVLHGKIIRDYGGTYCIKKKNGNIDFVGINGVIEFFDNKKECYAMKG